MKSSTSDIKINLWNSQPRCKHSTKNTNLITTIRPVRDTDDGNDSVLFLE